MSRDKILMIFEILRTKYLIFMWQFWRNVYWQLWRNKRRICENYVQKERIWQKLSQLCCQTVVRQYSYTLFVFLLLLWVGADSGLFGLYLMDEATNLCVHLLGGWPSSLLPIGQFICCLSNIVKGLHCCNLCIYLLINWTSILYYLHFNCFV